jgi:hypothetical protein
MGTLPVSRDAAAIISPQRRVSPRLASQISFGSHRLA